MHCFSPQPFYFDYIFAGGICQYTIVPCLLKFCADFRSVNGNHFVDNSAVDFSSPAEYRNKYYSPLKL